ncbi:MAG: tetratricopeptide repeat protein [Chitinophagales bacterium]|nr:tetratricopeptide repeat protein [Chitinophagales bacterium]
MRKLLVLFVLFGLTLVVSAQATLKQNNPLKKYYEAQEHFQLNRFALALPLLNDFLQEQDNQKEFTDKLMYENAFFMKAVSEKQSKAADAKKDLLYFVEHYKGNANINTAYFHLGDLAFENSDYKEAIDYFAKVDEKLLPKAEAQEFAFKEAFVLFSNKKFTQARPKFEKVAKDLTSPYIEQANYYSGLCSYYTNDYKSAEKAFVKLENSKTYGKIVPYYITSIKFINKDYQGVVDYAEPKLKDNIRYEEEIYHLLGNAYFELKKYDKSKYYLELYRTKAIKVTPEDYYTLGFVQAQEGDCNKAVDNLKQLSPLDNELAQNAMYQLGQCYVKINKKEDARTAFQQASRMTFNKAITEESAFQFAKLSYELERTNEALIALKKFIVDYPNSKYFDEANEILADIFLTTKNYEEAMTIIESLPKTSPSLQKSYQQMAYARAVNAYNDNQTSVADDLFNKALKYTPNKSLEALSYYWKGDLAHQVADYKKSDANINKFLSLANSVDATTAVKINSGTANYILAYNEYKQKHYSNAVPFFKKAVNDLKNTTDNDIKQNIYADALLRLADCYFIQKEYSNASTPYNEVIKNNFNGADYALYQKAIIDGIQGNLNDRIAGMNTLVARFPNSAFADDALMQAANALFAMNNLSEAEKTYKNLIQKYPNSDKVPEAYLQIGLINYNQNNLDAALNWYKSVVQKYPKSPEANEAMLVIKDIYIAQGDPNGFIKFAKNYPGANITVSQQDSILYLSAENQYQKGNTQGAINGFNDYLLQYPNGFFATPAHFYRGESFYNQQVFDKAFSDYKYVINQNDIKFLERATARAAYIAYYKQDDNTQAYQLYKQLESIATIDDNKNETKIGLMRTSFNLKKYSECLQYIEQVKAIPNLPEYYSGEIAYYKGMSNYYTNNKTAAITDLKNVSNNNDNLQAAESQYILAKIYFDNKDYKNSEKAALDYTAKFPAYEYYLGKTYILLSDIYVVQGNLLQAKATLESVVENYSKEDDVMQEAKAKLQAVIDKEKGNSNLKLPNNSDMLQFDNH